MRSWAHGLFRPRGLFYPVWIYGSVDARHYYQHDSVAYDRKRFLRNGYGFRVTDSPEEFRRFYSEIYLPFSRSTYGDAAEICSLERALGKFRKWDLVLVEKDGETIAGGQIVYTPEAPKLSLTGVKDVSRALVKEGAVASIYYFIVEHLRARGHDSVNFGVVRPALHDGLMRFKRQRGFRAQSWADHGYALIPLQRTEGLERFLRNTPWVRVAGGKLVSTVFGGAAEEASPAELA